MEDGNGDKEDTLQFNVKTARAWVGFIAAVFSLAVAIAGAVWAGVQFGITGEVHEQIGVECEPDGMIDRHVQRISKEYMEEVQGVIQDDLDDFDGRVGGLELQAAQTKGSVDALISANERNVEEIKMLLQEAIEANGGG
jgi:hypothetical protein